VKLTYDDHDRDRAGLVHVYPVISRRARGLSIGVNLNPNNACNFRCVYCQVPDLKAGKAPEIDLELLERELRGFLDEVVHGDFLERCVPEGLRRVNDIAFSGNGEPTTAERFDEIVELAGRIVTELGLAGKLKLVLITNGSAVHRTEVQRGLARMSELSGEVWFKVDSATDEGLARINGFRGGAARQRENLKLSCRLCPTWLQTCLFSMDGAAPSAAERAAYLELLRWIASEGLPLRGVQLYTLARPSCQPEAERLSPLGAEALEERAREIRALGIEVSVSASAREPVGDD